MTPGSFGLARHARLGSGQKAHELVAHSRCRAARPPGRRCARIARAGRPGRAAGRAATNVREVRITETLAARHEALMLGAPAVKLIIAGTRPIACSAKNVTATPTEFGSITPTAPPGAAKGRELGSQHLRRQDQLAVAEFDPRADRRPRACRCPRVLCASASASNSVRSMRRGGDGRLDHDVLQREAGRLPPQLALERRVEHQPARRQERHRELREQRLPDLRRLAGS